MGRGRVGFGRYQGDFKLMLLSFSAIGVPVIRFGFWFVRCVGVFVSGI